MKKLKLKLGKGMLSKEQMKKISGGYNNVCFLEGEAGYNCNGICYDTRYDGGAGSNYPGYGPGNCNTIGNPQAPPLVQQLLLLSCNWITLLM